MRTLQSEFKRMKSLKKDSEKKNNHHHKKEEKLSYAELMGMNKRGLK